MDTTSQAEATGKNKPGIAEIKAIAEEGSTYGLPIVMNSAVMCDTAIDRNSGQWKAPFNFKDLSLAHKAEILLGVTARRSC